jgi:Protein of unknown function (DUF3606)
MTPTVPHVVLARRQSLTGNGPRSNPGVLQVCNAHCPYSFAEKRVAVGSRMGRMSGEQPPTQDPTQINLADPVAIAYWCQRFGVTIEQLKEAVANVGNSAARVERELRRR